MNIRSESLYDSIVPNYAFLSDIHMDHIRSGDHGIHEFIESIKRTGPDGLIITGDISNGASIARHLKMLEQGLQIPILFVTGNHDVWETSFDALHKQMMALTASSTFLRYLPSTKYVEVSNVTAVVGANGWYDGTAGAGAKSRLIMNDWMRIRDYRERIQYAKTMKDVRMQDIIDVSQEHLRGEIAHMHSAIKEAVKTHRSIIVCTHVPPWQETHVYNGATGEPEGAPWFTSPTMATLLERAADAYPTNSFTVLCGHTHGKISYQVRNNMVCHVAHAEYGDPKIESMLSL